MFGNYVCSLCLLAIKVQRTNSSQKGWEARFQETRRSFRCLPKRPGDHPGVDDQ